MLKIFTGNIPFSISEDDLEYFFEKAGCKPSSTKLMKDRDTGESRGFAFLKFADAETAQRAIELDGSDLAGRSLRISEARPDDRGREKRSARR